MNNMQSKTNSTTTNYILIIVLAIVAFSGTVFLVLHAINKPPFDLELSADFANKNGIQCASKELISKNIPYEIVSFDEKEWIVLRVIEDKNELHSILANECSAFRKSD